MDDKYYELLGFISGILFPLSIIPQIYKSYKTKDLNDISYYWQFTFISALILALIYSFHFNLKPIYTSSLFELTLMLILTFMKFLYRNNNNIINPEENV